jgi:hypothetical protein
MGVHRPLHGVGQVGLHAIGLEALGVVGGPAPGDLRRDADHGGASRHVGQHDGIGPHPGAPAEGDRPEDLGAGADDHVVLQRRVPLGVALRGRIDGRRDAAERHVMVERHVVAHLGGLADDHAQPMVDEQALADPRAGMDLDAGQDAAEIRHEPGHQLKSQLPQPVRQPVEHHGVEAGIGEDDLKLRARSRVALHAGGEVGGENLEHGETRCDMLAPALSPDDAPGTRFA